MGQAKRRDNKIRPKAPGNDTSAVFSNFQKCQPEVDEDVISGLAVDYVGMNVRVKFDDSKLNIDRIIRLFACAPVLRTLCSI